MSHPDLSGSRLIGRPLHYFSSKIPEYLRTPGLFILHQRLFFATNAAPPTAVSRSRPDSPIMDEHPVSVPAIGFDALSDSAVVTVTGSSVDVSIGSVTVVVAFCTDVCSAVVCSAVVVSVCDTVAAVVSAAGSRYSGNAPLTYTSLMAKRTVVASSGQIWNP